LGEIEKKLAFEVSNLKVELVLSQAKLESECHDRQTVEQALRESSRQGRGRMKPRSLFRRLLRRLRC
jgi:hypothetical protein